MIQLLHSFFSKISVHTDYKLEMYLYHQQSFTALP